jgi:hypothetical protein
MSATRQFTVHEHEFSFLNCILMFSAKLTSISALSPCSAFRCDEPLEIQETKNEKVSDRGGLADLHSNSGFCPIFSRRQNRSPSKRTTLFRHDFGKGFVARATVRLPPRHFGISVRSRVQLSLSGSSIWRPRSLVEPAGEGRVSVRCSEKKNRPQCAATAAAPTLSFDHLIISSSGSINRLTMNSSLKSLT